MIRDWKGIENEKKNKMMRLWKYRAFIATALFILVSTAFFIVFYFLIKVKSIVSIVKTLSKSQNDSFE